MQEGISGFCMNYLPGTGAYDEFCRFLGLLCGRGLVGKQKICYTAISCPICEREVDHIEVFWIFLISFALVSVLVCGLMVALKGQSWKTALMLVAVFIAFLLALINATARPDNMGFKAYWAWVAFLPALAGATLRFCRPELERQAGVLVMIAILLNLVCAFL